MNSFSILLKKLIRRLKFYYNFYWRHKADCANYLRSRGAQIGENCGFRGGLDVFCNAEPYLIRLGNNVRLTKGVMLVTHDGGTLIFRKINPAWKEGTVKMGAIEIGDNVFVGVGSIILQNTKIGSNVVIGAGSVVTRDIPSDVVAVGVPARVVGTIEDYIQRSLENSITIPDEYLKDRQAYLSDYFWKNNLDH